MQFGQFAPITNVSFLCDIRIFAVIHNFGIHIYSYEGKLIGSPKYPVTCPEMLTASTFSLSNDTIAIREINDEKLVSIFDIKTGEKSCDTYKHQYDITQVKLNQTEFDRCLLILDQNRDLFIVKVDGLLSAAKKICGIVDSFAWHEEQDLIFAHTDGKPTVWWYPKTFFIDDDLIDLSKITYDHHSLGQNTTCVSFDGTSCIIRRSDGAMVSIGHISLLPGMLNAFASKKQWEQAIRLCRAVKIKELWACLAAMSIYGNDLNTAEVAYANIEMVHKVQFVNDVKNIKSSAGRLAELALLRKQPKEAEGILLASNLVYRAIRLNINSFNWERFIFALQKGLRYFS